jgi:hypothetical protein
VDLRERLSSAPSTLSAQPPQPPQPAARPYVRLFTQIGVTPDAARINALRGADLERALKHLARWFVHLHGATSHIFPLGHYSLSDAPAEGETTLAEKLAPRGVTVSNYRNGSYVSQAKRGTLLFSEAATVEREAPLGIGTWWAGQPSHTTGGIDDTAARLASAVGPDEQRLEVTSAAANRPAGAPANWPFAPSRGTGADRGQVCSDSTRDFVSWVRVEDEIMRVLAVEDRGSTVVLAVDRGYFGTRAATHAKGSRAFSPVYIGNRAAASWDTGLAGPPARNDPDAALRYATKIWQGPESGRLGDAITWQANRIKASFGAGRTAPYLQGLNGIWLDITSSNPYNNSDLYGNPITPWDDLQSVAMAPNRWGIYQEVKLRGLKAQIGPATSYPELRWMANNLLVRGELDAAAQDRLMSQAGYQGGALEHWLQGTQLPENAARWRAQMAQHFRIQANNWPAIYWAKWNELGAGTVDQYKRLTYGGLLLAYLPHPPGGTRTEYGGPFQLSRPDQLYFWDWGDPVEMPSSVDETRVAGDGAAPGALHARRFERGVVLVNAGTTPATCSLGRRCYDVSRPAAGAPPVVEQVTVSARDAVFLQF